MRAFIMPLVYLIILGVGGSKIFKKNSFSMALPIAILVNITVMILGALLLGDLRIGLYFYTASSVLFVLKGFFYDKRGNEIIKIIVSFDTIIFIVLYSLFYFLNYYKAYISWDEFSHWGPMAKEMYRLNDFYFKSDRSFAHSDYVPFITVFEYAICKLGGMYRETMVYQAIQIFMISLFMPLLGIIANSVFSSNLVSVQNYKKKIYTLFLQTMCVIAILSSLILLQNSFSFFHSIYTDLPFGLICGFGMIYCYYQNIDNKIDAYLIIELVVIMTAIVMTKMMGIIFVPVILVMTWLIMLKDIDIKNKFKIIIPQSIIPMAIWGLFKYESKKYLSISGNQSFDGAFSGIVSLFTKGFTQDYQREVSDNFISAVISSQSLIASKGTYLNLSILSVLIGAFFIILAYVLVKFNVYIKADANCNIQSINVKINFIKRIKNSKFTMDNYKSIMMAIGTALTSIYYCLWMYILYQVSFGEYEATKLASYSRYMGSYVASIIIILIYIVTQRFIILLKYLTSNNEDHVKIKTSIYIIAVFLFVMVIVWYDNASGKYKALYDDYVNSIETYQNTIISLNKIDNIRECIEKNSEGDSSIIFIQQNSNGKQYIRYNYYLMDTIKTTSWASFKVSEDEKNEGDVWSTVISSDNLVDKLSKYDFIYIDMLDENFVNDYGQIFDIEPVEGNIYKVIIDNDSIKITYLNNIL